MIRKYLMRCDQNSGVSVNLLRYYFYVGLYDFPVKKALTPLGGVSEPHFSQMFDVEVQIREHPSRP